METKFRAWLKDQKIMLQSSDISHCLLLNGKILRLSLISSSSDELSFFREDVSDNIELMQFTGLKDKEGAEAYKDDKIKTFDGRILFIDWLEWQWILRNLDGSYECSMGEISPQFTVIGNKWEVL